MALGGREPRPEMLQGSGRVLIHCPAAPAAPHLPARSSRPQLGFAEVRQVGHGLGLPHGLGGVGCEEESGSGVGAEEPIPPPRAAPGSDPEQGQEHERQARRAGL